MVFLHMRSMYVLYDERMGMLASIGQTSIVAEWSRECVYEYLYMIYVYDQHANNMCEVELN
jgi:hypothetical protein